MSYTTNSEPAQNTKASMQASAGAASTGSMSDFLESYTPSAAMSKSSTQGSARGVAIGSARDFPWTDTLGTTVSNAITIVDNPSPTSFFPQGVKSKKRKRGAIGEPVVINISDDSDDGNSVARTDLATFMPKSKTKAPRAKEPKRKREDFEGPKGGEHSRVEKRLHQFRERAPYKFQDRLDRAISQPMFLIDRERKLNSDGTHEVEKFDMAGSTGNIYEVTIDKKPKCTCMDATIRGNQCKHIIYVLVNVLKAPEHLQYQQALLSTELKEIFEHAPVTPQSSNGSEDTSHPGKRKPIEGDCPVCVIEFKPSDEILWCKAACGNNIHKTCFDQWAKSKPGPVKCVYCRTVWKEDDDATKKIGKHGAKNKEGYVNVARQLGLSGVRDHSSYHQPWFDDEGYGGFAGFY
ncbi:hypothetical protein VF21_06749 [Pseudogymnoascus sp. 05NY08]|nr:hypothetical protein VF21_06749 [Pseudogymnoascus sp. 05NY08]